MTDGADLVTQVEDDDPETLAGEPTGFDPDDDDDDPDDDPDSSEQATGA